MRGGETSEPAEPSESIRARVAASRERQHRRQGTPKAGLAGRRLREFCDLRGDAEALFSRAIDRMGLSGRGHDRVLRVARTVADLSGQEEISTAHLAEALHYRSSGFVDH